MSKVPSYVNFLSNEFSLKISQRAQELLSSPFTDSSLLFLFRTVLNWFPPYQRTVLLYCLILEPRDAGSRRPEVRVQTGRLVTGAAQHTRDTFPNLLPEGIWAAFTGVLHRGPVFCFTQELGDWNTVGTSKWQRWDPNQRLLTPNCAPPTLLGHQLHITSKQLGVMCSAP